MCLSGVLLEGASGLIGAPPRPPPVFSDGFSVASGNLCLLRGESLRDASFFGFTGTGCCCSLLENTCPEEVVLVLTVWCGMRGPDREESVDGGCGSRGGCGSKEGLMREGALG